MTNGVSPLENKTKFIFCLDPSPSQSSTTKFRRIKRGNYFFEKTTNIHIIDTYKQYINYNVYQKALILAFVPVFTTNNLWEFTKHTLKFKGYLVVKTSVLNAIFGQNMYNKSISFEVKA